MKIIFLDRDGVINKFPGNGNYVTKVKDFHFIPGALEAMRILTQQGFTLFVVSNQAGVGKGIFSKKKLEQITQKMIKDVKQSGGKIKKVFYSTSRSDQDCQFRKPNIGSIREAMKLMNKSIHTARKAFFVGDTEVDVKTGRNAGCKTIFVLSGREDYEYLKKRWKVRPNYIARDLMDATQIICEDDRQFMTTVKRPVMTEAAKKKSLSANNSSRII